jgi:hypothetical protein
LKNLLFIVIEILNLKSGGIDQAISFHKNQIKFFPKYTPPYAK